MHKEQRKGAGDPGHQFANCAGLFLNGADQSMQAAEYRTGLQCEGVSLSRTEISQALRQMNKVLGFG